MTDVFLCETGQLTSASRKALREAGVVVAEVADPSKCQFIRAGQIIEGDDMLWACLDALKVETGSYGRDQRERLAQNLLKVVVQERKAAGRVTT